MVKAFRQWVKATYVTVEELKQAWGDFARAETFERLGLTHTCCNSRNNDFEDRLEVQEEECELIDDLNTWVKQYDEEVYRHLDFASLDWDTTVSQLDGRLGGFDDPDALLGNEDLDIEWQHRQQSRDRAAGRPVKPIQHSYPDDQLQRMLTGFAGEEKVLRAFV